MKQESLSQWWLIVPLLLMVAFIAILSVDRSDLIRNAEHNSFRHIGGFEANYSLVDTVSNVSSTSAQHVPLYFLILNIWVHMVGNSIEMLRTLSVFFGLLSIASAYRLSSLLLSRRVAFFVAFIMSTSAYFLFYMHETRMYTLMPFLVIGLYTIYWHIISSSQSIQGRYWLALYLVSTAIVYTHTVGIFALIAIGFYHLFWLKKDRRWFNIVGIMLLAGLSFAPWLPVFMDGATTRQDLSDEKLSTIESIITLAGVYTNQFYLFVILWIVGLVAIIRERSKWIVYILVISIVPIVALIIVHNITPLLILKRMRYTTMLLPSFALILAYGIHVLTRWRRGFILILLIFPIAGIQFSQTDLFRVYTRQLGRLEQYPAFHLIVDYVHNHPIMPSPEPLFTMSSDEAPRSLVQYYSNLIDNTYLHINPDHVLTEVRDVLTETLVDLIDFENEPAFWLAYRPDYDLISNSAYRNILIQYHDSCGVQESNESTIIEYYLKKGIPCQLIDSDISVQYLDDELSLSHFYQALEGDKLELFSIWSRADATVAFPYSISFKIFDTEGNQVLQQDYISPFEPIDRKEFDVSDLEAGTYTLKLTLYNAETGYINQGRMQSNDPQNDITLTEFTISR